MASEKKTFLGLAVYCNNEIMCTKNRKKRISAVKFHYSSVRPVVLPLTKKRVDCGLPELIN